MSDPLSNNDDDELRALFDRQREADQKRAPSFHTLRTRALAEEQGAATQPKRMVPMRELWPSAVALVALLTLIITADHFPQKRASSPQQQQEQQFAQELAQIDRALRRSATTEELMAWQSPTDFLIYPTTNPNHP
jgi:hypothetical protein